MQLLRKYGRVAVLAALCAFCAVAYGHNFDKMSPEFFGPNALPVPDMLDGTVSERIYAELSCDYYAGRYGDATHDIFALVRIPVFTSRFNLSVWMPVVEFYRNTPQSVLHQQAHEPKMRGHEFGNVYVTADVQLLRRRKILPDASLRVGLITASGGGHEYGRYFDTLGYFFDASLGKSVNLGSECSLRLALNAGFLCWQVAEKTQNDAYMYGLQAMFEHTHLEIAAAWQGYTGWIGNGDSPMVLKAKAVWKAGRFRPLAAYQYGLRDWPFRQFRIGLGYVF